jgi:polyisoprenoid-binding protein YceI
MKKIFIAVLSIVTVLGTVAFTKITKKSDTVNFSVDTKNSKVEWSGSKKNGYHPGYFLLKEGTLKVNEGKIVGGSFTIDVAGVKVTDGAGEKLEGHLKTADFFDAANFPDANFEINNVKYTDENTAQISGTLTLRGTKSEVKFDAKVRSISDTKVFAEAFFSLDRTVFGVSYGKGNVSNDVQIAVRLYASK